MSATFDRLRKIPVMSEAEAAELTIPLSEAPARLLEVMAKHGVAIVTGVLSEDEVSAAEARFGADLHASIDWGALLASSAPEEVRRLAHTDAAALPHALPADTHFGRHGTCFQQGICQGRFAWAMRTHPKVRAVYEILHPDEPLVVSEDLVFYRSTGIAAGAATAIDPVSWPHADVNAHNPRVAGWEITQGVLYIWPSTSSDCATTVVWPRSHEDVFRELMDDPAFTSKEGRENHFCLVSKMQRKDAQEDLTSRWFEHARRVPVPAGGLLLWSSRIMHQGWGVGHRLAIPICLEPASRRSQKARRDKLLTALTGRATSHWASLGILHSLTKRSPCCAVEGTYSEERVDANQLPRKACCELGCLTEAGNKMSVEERESLANAVRAAFRSGDVDAQRELMERMERLIVPEVLSLM
mmetsp:Transcript_10921/g.34808  ORF Transcript_10921/g.34808 Transcript_10921/m.34808 type:complete len:413 (-) Transcript_10921:72-1310(-)